MYIVGFTSTCKKFLMSNTCLKANGKYMIKSKMVLRVRHKMGKHIQKFMLNSAASQF